jgi:multiple sugar transport system permease protein
VRRRLNENTIKWALLLPTLVLLLAFFAFPLIWTFLTSLKPNTEIYEYPISSYLPIKPTLINYVQAWSEPSAPFGTFLMNSVIVSLSTTLITILVSMFAGYSLARGKFAGSGIVALLLLTTQMFPSALLITPLLSQWSYLGLLNTYQVLILSYLTFTVPFTVWMLMGYFQTIPYEIEESAMVDGCGRFDALIRIVLPLAAPGIAASAAYAFVSSWGELLFAVSFINSKARTTLPAGLLYMFGQTGVRWDILTAATMISLIPVLVFFAFFQKYLISGLVTGAVKH